MTEKQQTTGDTRLCDKCGRIIALYRTSEGLFLMAHRPVTFHTPATPWCLGGGRKVGS